MEREFVHSLLEGDFGNGFALRQGLVEGDFWTRRQGALTIYRGEGSCRRIDYQQILLAPTDKGRVELAGQEHLPGRDYFYAVRAISGTGRQEKNTRAMAKVSFDAAGNPIG